MRRETTTRRRRPAWRRRRRRRERPGRRGCPRSRSTPTTGRSATPSTRCCRRSPSARTCTCRSSPRAARRRAPSRRTRSCGAAAPKQRSCAGASITTCRPPRSTWQPHPHRCGVARDAVSVAEQALEQAEDRFKAGVANNLEVVQAQQALTTSRENYIGELVRGQRGQGRAGARAGRRREGISAAAGRNDVMAEDSVTTSPAPSTSSRRTRWILAGGARARRGGRRRVGASGRPAVH